MICQPCHGNGYLRTDDNAACPDCVVPDQPLHPLPRSVALETAKAMITGDRERDHGAIENNFQAIADFWSCFLGVKITPAQAATMMALLKIARMKSNPKKDDHYVDAIGYCAIAHELIQADET